MFLCEFLHLLKTLSISQYGTISDDHLLDQYFWQNGILFTGGEDRNITAWDTTSGKIAYSIEDAHAARVKGIVVLSKSSADAAGEEDPYIVASASSDGVIRVWDVRMVNKGGTKPLSEVNTKSRLTCLAGSSIRCEFVFS